MTLLYNLPVLCLSLAFALVSSLATDLHPNAQHELQHPQDLYDDSVDFLYKNMPKIDRGVISYAFIEQQTRLALKARADNEWAQQIPRDVFLNYVLPYASVDEPREDWRAEFYARFRSLVVNATSVSEAALVLNRDIWSIWGIVFKAGQTPEIMSPSQVIAAGHASCTGLSIFLVNACRAVGIPARVAGTPDWVTSLQARTTQGQGQGQGQGQAVRTGAAAGTGTGTDTGTDAAQPSGSKSKAADKAASAPGTGRRLMAGRAQRQQDAGLPLVHAGLRGAEAQEEHQAGAALRGVQDRPDIGLDLARSAVRDDDPFNNHNWVEVWLGPQQGWSFTGAAEWTSRGWNATWFYPQPVKQQCPGSYYHAVYAASFAPTPGHTHFPLAWAPDYTGVPAYDVTDYYIDCPSP